MPVAIQHKHSEYHRDVVPEDQLATGGVVPGYVVTATNTGEAEWEAPTSGGATFTTLAKWGTD